MYQAAEGLKRRMVFYRLINQPEMLVFYRNLAQRRNFQLVLKRKELWVVSENSHCVEGGKDSHVFCQN
jgi:hypothetical protein